MCKLTWGHRRRLPKLVVDKEASADRSDTRPGARGGRPAAGRGRPRAALLDVALARLLAAKLYYNTGGGGGIITASE